MFGKTNIVAISYIGSITCRRKQVEVLFDEEHVELNCFNIWSNMSKKMSYAEPFDIAPETQKIVD